MQIYEDLMHEIATASSSEEGLKVLQEEARRLGMQTVTWALKPDVALGNEQIVMVSTYPPEWLARYSQNNYIASDPTVKHGLVSIQPVIWSTTKNLAPQFWEDAASFGLRVGVAQSLCDSHGRCSMLTLSRDSTEFSQSELALKLPQLAWLAQIAHAGMVRHIIPPELIDKLPILTTRQREILQLVSIGLTSQQIADRLRVTKHTSDKHMDAVRSKLHAENKIDAVARAIRLGII
ncbi:LuxR family transcriptional regulator [Massilia sp. DJPM01]|uniref:helix-turn-helix transcriptional regulator n=1 Tax=Massilia sp. DJPM01 TaxID=3024404 RepID=UPI00259F7AC7|nr:LuxR family transcriptional regulator [Massilia sp. DJPM01]MDM5181929.1 LuxR family transcriptional regulator [Massilia sp. DJPM01]